MLDWFVKKIGIIFLFLLLLIFSPQQALASFVDNQSASVVIGQQNFSSISEDQGGATAANTMAAPYSAVIYQNKLVVADYLNNRVLIYNSIPTTNNASADVVIGQINFSNKDSNQGGSINLNTMAQPIALLVVNGKLFISDFNNSRVLIYNSIPTTNNASADVVIGQNSVSGGTSGTAVNRLNNPIGLAYDETSGKLAIADFSNHRVLIYNNIPTSSNASADVVVGQVVFSGGDSNQGGSTASNTLSYPSDVKFINSKLVVTDTGNNRVLIYDGIPTSNNASAVTVIGQQGFFSADANQGVSPTAKTLNAPSGITTDGTKVFIGDASNYRILIFDTLPTSNNASAANVLGQPNFFSANSNQGGTPSANTFNTIDGGLFWTDGKLYVSESYNNRVLIFIDSGYRVQSKALPPGCSSYNPEGVPHIFQAQVGMRDVTLFFTRVKVNNSGYVIGYGYGFDNKLRFGDEILFNASAGVMSYSIHELEPGIEYFFLMHGQNGCMPGDWGNTVKVTTLGKGNKTSKTVYFE